MRIGLFVDISSLYYCVSRKFEGRKLDYAKYLELIKQQGEVIRALAYGVQRDDEAQGFITCLRHLGYEPKYKQPQVIKIKDEEIRRADWGIGITLDVVRALDRVDTIVLGSADINLVPLANFIAERGLACHIVACGIARDLKRAATQYVEITEDVLEEKDDLPNDANGISA